MAKVGKGLKRLENIGNGRKMGGGTIMEKVGTFWKRLETVGNGRGTYGNVGKGLKRLAKLKNSFFNKNKKSPGKGRIMLEKVGNCLGN